MAGADEYNKAKVGRTALLNSVYKDVKPEAARIGKTVDVYFPDIGPLQAINNGILTGTSVTPNYIPLVFQTRAGAALQFQDFEQWQTAVDLAQKFFDPLYKRAREYLNGQIAALVTTSNFNANAPIIGALQGEVGVADQLNAWGTLSDQKVPLEDSEKLSLLVHNRVYQKMLGDAGWVQESLVSATIAAAARETADLAHAFNFQPKWDQQMPTASGSILYGQVDAHVRVGHGHRAQHQLHHRGHRRRPPHRVLPGLRQRPDQDPVQGDRGGVGHLAHAQQRDPDHAGRQRYRHDDRAADHPGLGHVHHGRRFDHRHQLQFHGGQHRPVAAIRDRHQRRDLGQLLPDHGDFGHDLHRGHRRSRPSTLGRCTQRSSPTPTWPCTSTRSPWPCGRSPRRTRPATSSTSRYIDLMGIPLRVMVSYVHIYQALFVTVDFGYALGVIRPDFGVIITC